MSIIVEKGRNLSFGIKVAAGALTAFILVGLLARLTREDKGSNEPNQIAVRRDVVSTDVRFVPCVVLDVPSDAPEADWSASLARMVNGRTEVVLPLGRVDVVSKTHAIEVDRWEKWKEGLGQAIYYGSETGLIPTLALIRTAATNDDSLGAIETLALSKGVRLVVLESALSVGTTADAVNVISDE